MMDVQTERGEPAAVFARARREAFSPLADALEAADAHADAGDQLHALEGVIHALVRLLGVVALAARAQFGPGPDERREAVEALLNRLKRRELTDQQWVDLTEAVLSAWRAAPARHALPPLVELFSPRAEGAEFRAALRRSLDAAERRHGSAEDSRDDLGLSLREARGRLAMALRALELIWRDAPMVVCHADAFETWCGVTPAAERPREPLGAITRPPPPGQVALRCGPASALALFPFARVEGARLFLLQGGRSGDAYYEALKDGAQHVERRGWDHLDRCVALVRDEASADDDRNPFRGLKPFERADRATFFGRKAQVEACAKLVEETALLVIFGASGVGKSSFVRAGLAPRLDPAPESNDRSGDGGGRWRCVVMRPGQRPLAELRKRLVEATRAWPGGVHTEAAVEAGGDALIAHFAAFEREHGLGLVLVIDQTEELFAHCTDPKEQRAFAARVAALARQNGGATRVVACVRVDFVAQFDEVLGQQGTFRDKVNRETYQLSAPGPDELEETLREPLRIAGYDFEDDALVRDMLAEVRGKTSALLLLQVAASRMWDERDRVARRLTRRSLAGMNGVTGVIAHIAEGIYGRFNEAEKKTAERIFRRLCTSAGDRAPRVPRSELIDASNVGVNETAVLGALIDGRLLIVQQSGDSREEPTVELSHERIQDHWGRLREWLAKGQDDLRQHERLREAATQWEAQGHDSGVLWRGGALERAVEWRSRTKPALSKAQEEFLRASITDTRRRRRAQSALAVLVAGVLLALGLFVALQWREAVHARSRSNALAAQMLLEMRQPLLAVGRTDVLERSLAAMERYYARRRRTPWLEEVENLLGVDPDVQEVRLKMQFHAQRGELASARGDSQTAIAELTAAYEVGRAMESKYQDDEDFMVDYTCTLGKLASELRSADRCGDADRYAETALQIARERHRKHPGNLRWYREVAVTLANRYCPSSGPRKLSALREALRIHEDLARRAPGDTSARREYAQAHLHLGYLFEDTERNAEARREFQTSYEILGSPTQGTALDRRDARAAAYSLFRWGMSLNNAGDARAAEEKMRLAVQLYEDAGIDYGDIELLKDLQFLHAELAWVLHRTRDVEGARLHAQRAMHLSERLLRVLPRVSRGSHIACRASLSHYVLGSIHLDHGEYDPALQEYEQQARVCAPARGAHSPCCPNVRLAALLRLSAVRRHRRECQESVRQVQEALGFIEHESEVGPPNRARAHFRAGETFQTCGQLDEARAQYRAAVDGYRVVAERSPQNPDAAFDLADARERQGEVFAAAGDRASAEAELQAALTATDALVRSERPLPEWVALRARGQWQLAALLATERSSRARSRALAAEALAALQALQRDGRLSAEEASWIPEVERLAPRRSR